ncbi:MAG: FAD-binding oxidoreductase [Candidatus Eisenbacteria bacterium]|uniref:FAD-binding oxidoreductase n=1 Tax=Eiseniibacteriota bacterium TaxID=2212470 RepID=A0A849SMP0_UNCEI|nr:FAD-binding oxidoreductase [Candidatus Eisenbacteria bacterium]
MSDASLKHPVWWREAPPAYPELHGELDADVVIVGGGITGVTLAYTLAEQSATVVMLEADRIASAASGRNAGFLLAAPAEPYSEAIAMWNRDGARAMVTTGRRAHQRVKELVGALELECDYRLTGSLRLCRTEEEAEDQRASLPELNADGFRMLETQVHGNVPVESEGHFKAAFLMPEDGEFHPVKFLHGVAVGAAGLGARLFEHSSVKYGQWRAGLWHVHTAHGVVRARTVVIATNAYAPKLVPALSRLIAPRRGQLLCTAPIDRTIAARPTYAHWGYQSWRQLPDSRLVIGGWRDVALDTEVGFEQNPTEQIQSAIESGLRDLVPEGAAIEHRWAGTMGFARDGRPLVGWLDPEHHVAISAGYTGHGMGMAPACTLDLAALINWKPAPGIATFDPARFNELRDAREGTVLLGAAVG